MKIKTATIRKGRRMPVWCMVLLDLLLTGAVLCVFALFHHVLPRALAARSEPSEPIAVITPAPAQETPAQADEPAETETPEPEPETWAERFAEHFTAELVTTETGYSSPNVSVQITENQLTLDGRPQRYYVADVYITDILSFRTGAAYNGFTRYSAEDAVDLDKASDAIVLTNGDYCSTQRSGFLIRNGEVYYTDPTTCDICVLFYDGTMETYAGAAYDVDSIMEAGPYQVWKFGPALLDSEGLPLDDFNTSTAIKGRHPRTGIGYYEPGHYCLVVVDGRQYGATGMTLDEFAEIFAGLGCQRAYNLDGGASSVMTFNDTLQNTQSSYRPIGDTVYIREPESAGDGGEDGTES